MSQYIDPGIFNNIQILSFYITDTTYEHEQFVKEYITCKFILNAPIGSGKSTALMKHIYENKTNSYIIVVPTINIANSFFDLIDCEEDSIKLCVQDGAFKYIKHAIDDTVEVIITTYHTASKCLGSIIEFTHGSSETLKSASDRSGKLLDKYRLFIDEAHLLLQHPPLIEMTREFSYVGLITATPRELRHLSVFNNYIHITPSIKTHYQIKLYIHTLGESSFGSFRNSTGSHTLALNDHEANKDTKCSVPNTIEIIELVKKSINE